MMILAKNLIGLRAETKSGQYLGRVKNFEIDIETLEAARFYVRPVGLIKGLVAGDLIIAKSSVISVDDKKMTVLDLVGEELAMAGKEKKALVMEGTAVSASNLE
jgi:sporulation protein YlmC with PRC-barrel domain